MKTKLLILVLLIAGANTIFSQSPREIAEKASNAIDPDAMEMSATLNIYDNRGNVRERQLAVASRKFGDVHKTQMRFLSPPDIRGTAMLIYDHDGKGDDMWIYMPSLRRTRRIVSSEKGSSFMGSEFSNADMSAPNIDDFTYKLIDTETINGKTCWVIESTCKTPEIAEENGFNKQIAYIEQNTYLTHKVKYYDFYDELHKIMTIFDYRKQADGSYFAFKMEMENLHNGRKSIYVVNQFQLGSDLQERDFSTSALEQF